MSCVGCNLFSVSVCVSLSEGGTTNPPGTTSPCLHLVHVLVFFRSCFGEGDLGVNGRMSTNTGSFSAAAGFAVVSATFFLGDSSSLRVGRSSLSGCGIRTSWISLGFDSLVSRGLALRSSWLRVDKTDRISISFGTVGFGGGAFCFWGIGIRGRRL